MRYWELGMRKFASRRFLIMASSTTSKILNFFIAAVWLVNGLFCKVLNLVPRHQEIVATILGQEHARLLTIAIGISEVLMAL